MGQRKGLGVALGDPRYVVRIDHLSRQVIIGEKTDLEQRSLQADRTNWLTDIPFEEPFPCQAQIRYNSQAHDATATIQRDGLLEITFDQPCHAVAPGQAVVCFDQEVVLGGGWIL